MAAADAVRATWDGLPERAKIAVSGVLIGMVGNYGTRAVDTLVAGVVGSGVLREAQLLLVAAGLLYLFDAIQRARLAALEDRLLDAVDGRDGREDDEELATDGGAVRAGAPSAERGMVSGALVGTGLALPFGAVAAVACAVIGAGAGALLERRAWRASGTTGTAPTGVRASRRPAAGGPGVDPFDVEATAYLWLALEHGRSILLVGGDEERRRAALNAIGSLIEPDGKIVSVEAERRLDLPGKRNWIASVTAPADAAEGDASGTDLLEAALRQRPGYVLVDGVDDTVSAARYYQVAATGHAGVATMAAGSAAEALDRLADETGTADLGGVDVVVEVDPAAVSAPPIARCRRVVEVLSGTDDEGRPETRTVLGRGGPRRLRSASGSRILEATRDDRGWGEEALWREVDRRSEVLAELAKRGIRGGDSLAAVVEAFYDEDDAAFEAVIEREPTGSEVERRSP